MNDLGFANLGSCCNCGKTGTTVRHVILLHKRAPEPGKGWGCLECGLPSDGAFAVLCGECILPWTRNETELKNAVAGYPYENRRVPYEQLTEPFEHNEEMHKEEEIDAEDRTEDHARNGSPRAR